MRPPAAAVSLLLLTLVAAPAAALTLSDFEEPHRGSDVSGGVAAFEVTEAEADEPRILVYRNDPRSVFNLSVVDEAGDVVFTKRGTRGVQTLPGLPVGHYRFTIGGEGEFQVTDKAIRQLGTTSGTLRGTDAYVLSIPSWTNVSVSGNVVIEAWNLQAIDPVTLAQNETILLPANGALILTLRGENGTEYEIHAVETAAPEAAPEAATPAPGLLGLLGAGVGAAFARARRRARTAEPLR